MDWVPEVPNSVKTYIPPINRIKNVLIVVVFLSTKLVEMASKVIRCIMQDVLVTCDRNPTQTGSSIKRNVWANKNL